MTRRILLYLKDFSFILVSSGLLVLSFPNFDLGLLVWVGLVPLLFAIIGKTPRYSFFLSLACGVLFFIGTFFWIIEVQKFLPFHHLVLLFYTGAYFGLFGLAFSIINTRWGGTPAFLAAPFLWVSLEYIRAHMFFLSLPWGILGQTQYKYPSIIQICDLTGTYGISFLIVLVNSTITVLVCHFFTNLNHNKSFMNMQPSLKAKVFMSVVATLLITLSLVYGHVMISKPLLGELVKVSVVQGNIEQRKKWDRKYARYVMQTYANGTKEAAKEKPDLIIWPETATPGSITRDARLKAQVRHITKEASTYLLLGSSQQQKFKEKRRWVRKLFNSAFLISPKPGLAKTQRYDKIKLLPFGEYLPLKEIIPWSSLNVPEIGGYVPGDEYTVFRHPKFRFGVTICWENLFPDLFRRFVKEGAQFMVNITNEAWFRRTAAPYMFLSMSVFRAVENRIFVIRSSNTGVSCFIDPYGRIVDRVKDASGQDIFVRGVLTESVVLLESKTFYTRYGDWLALASLPCSIFFLFFSFIKRDRDSR